MLLLALGLWTASCSAKKDAETTNKDASLVLFKPGFQYQYVLTGKDSLGKDLPTQQITLQMAGSPSQKVEEQNLDNSAPHASLPLAGHWQMSASPDTLGAAITTDEHAYSLGLPPLSPQDFVQYTLPLEVDWVMEPGTPRTKLVTGLTKGTLHPGKSYAIRRNITYMGNEDLSIGKQQHAQCRKLVAQDESPIGQVKITYWVHPEAGFVKAIYQLGKQERTYSLQK